MNWQPYIYYPGLVLWLGMFIFIALIPWRVKRADAALGNEESELKGIYWRFLRGSLYAGALVSAWCRKRVMPGVELEKLSQGDRLLFQLFFWWVALGLIHLVIAYWFIIHFGNS